jgi:hypothetical protein
LTLPWHNALERCSKSQAAVGGSFFCFPECDSGHNAWGKPYCLNYFPDNGKCYMQPFSRLDMLTCNNKITKSSGNNKWLIVLGGSNSFFMMKPFVDILLEQPSNTTYDPKKYWNAYGNADPEHELAMMDFVFDSNHKNTHKNSAAFEYTAQCTSYCLPKNTLTQLMNAPPPDNSGGSFRLTYLSLHLLNEFISKFDIAMNPDSPWLLPTPSGGSTHVDVLLEWTGIWGDYSTVTEADHVNNINHLAARQAADGANIKSFVITDASSDCKSGVRDSSVDILSAFAATERSVQFDMQFFSKRDMSYNQMQLTSFCFTDGHSYQGINHVFLQRYFNMRCGAESSKEIGYAEKVPACLDLNTAGCFYKDPAVWISNLQPVCTATYSTIETDGFDESVYCPAPTAEKSERLPVCSNIEILDTKAASPPLTSLGFDIVVALLFIACMLKFLWDAWKDAMEAAGIPKDQITILPLEMSALISSKQDELERSFELVQRGSLAMSLADLADADRSQTESNRGKSNTEAEANGNALAVPSECPYEVVFDSPEAQRSCDTHTNKKMIHKMNSFSSVISRGSLLGSVVSHSSRAQDLDFSMLDEQEEDEVVHSPIDSKHSTRAKAIDWGMVDRVDQETQDGTISALEKGVERGWRGTDENSLLEAGAVVIQIDDHLSPQTNRSRGVKRQVSSTSWLTMSDFGDEHTGMDENDDTFLDGVEVVESEVKREKIYSLWSKLRTLLHYPTSADSARFDAINFARFLASIHIVMGHMYQGGHLGDFHGLNMFGYTWVPW